MHIWWHYLSSRVRESRDFFDGGNLMGRRIHFYSNKNCIDLDKLSNIKT
jgi:hypothetical protein